MSNIHKILDYLSGVPSDIKYVQADGRSVEPAKLRRFLENEIQPKLSVAFPFVLEGDPFRINEESRYVYSLPEAEDYPLLEGGLAPLPYEVMAVEVSAIRPREELLERRIWLVWKEHDGSLFHATMISVVKNDLIVGGLKLLSFPGHPDGDMQIQECFGVTPSDDDLDDAFFQLDFLNFVLIGINSSIVHVERIAASEALNKRRVAKGREKIRPFTRIDFRNNSGGRQSERVAGRASPEMYWRRGHNRNVGGKVIYVRAHVVGKQGSNPTPPPPQTYRVSPFPERD